MENTESSIFERSFNPISQALLTLGAILAVILGAKLVNLLGIIDVPQRFPWMTAASFMLFFAMLNAVFSLSSKDMMKYWGQSVYSYLGLALISGLVAYLFSSLSIDEAGSYRWIYLVLTFGYLVFLSIMSLMRKIVDFAQKEEWNHPRIRRKKKRR